MLQQGYTRINLVLSLQSIHILTFCLFHSMFTLSWICRFLQQSLRNKSLQMNDYKIALLCNAYSTNSECFTLPMGVLVETIYGNGNMRIPLPGTNCMASGSITPLPMNLLDSLTVHAKMRYGLAVKCNQLAFFTSESQAICSNIKRKAHLFGLLHKVLYRSSTDLFN